MIQISKTGIAQTKNRKLRKSQVLQIIELCRESDIPRYIVAEMFQVSITTISFIMSGYRWSNVTGISSLRFHNKVHSNAKLSVEDVKSIRKNWNNGKSQNSLAKKFNISQPVVFDIVHRRTYRGI